MKIKRHSGKDESQILLGMILSTPVVARLSSVWSRGMLGSDWSNTIADLCIKYYRKYHRAPGPAIQSLFEDWAETAGADTVGLVEKFMSQLDDDYKAMKKAVNPDYVIDCASTHLNKVAMRKVLEELDGDLEANQVQIAMDRLTTWKAVRVSADKGIDLFAAPDVVEAALGERQESLVKYPGALGTFFGDDLGRDCFVSFMAPEKTGKTQWLIDLALRGAQQQQKVAFFEVGDMSTNQIVRRIAQRYAKKPLKPKEIKIPTSMDFDDDEGDWQLTYKVKRFKKGLTVEEGVEAMNRSKMAGYFKLSVHAAGTISVQGIANELETWQREDDWVPDIVVIDYADILAPPAGVQDPRERINESWKQMRSLSQQLHCLVATATQSDAAAYNQKLITKSNFSDDKRKLAHVTALIGINQTHFEKAKKLQRLNFVVLRESEFLETSCVTVATCMDLAYPAVLSGFAPPSLKIK